MSDTRAQAPMNRPRMQITGPVIDAADAISLAEFYERLLGWTIADREPGWARLRSPAGDMKIEVQTEPHYRRPVWPAVPGAQQMMLHLDIEVDDLDTGVAWALAAGATVAEHQPQEGVRVMLDPEGHPFCLF